MHLKFFSYCTENSGNGSKIKINDGTTIFHLKLELEKIAKFPAHKTQIFFLEEILGDRRLLSTAAERCLIFGVVPPSDEYHKVDLMVINEDEFVGWLRAVANEEPPRSVMDMCDSKSLAKISSGDTIPVQERCVDAECSPQSSDSSNSIQSSNDGSNSIQSSGGNKCQAEPSNIDDDPTGPTGCRERCCPTDPNRPMYLQVMPENRQYAVVIESGSCPCLDVQRIMHFLTEHLKVSDEAKTVSFSVCAPVVPLDNALMIVGGDADSRDWILRATQPICPPFEAKTFIRYFGLIRWCIIIPMPNKWSFCRIFNILERQNCPLDTAAWVVVNQVILDPCSKDFKKKAVDEAYPNMEVDIYVDQATVCFVSDNCNKIDYLLWKLPFGPCGSIC
ncbi:hypothetical protein KR038_011243 [Drosophila bunnanda]|nr:hypothetical protein KR038_011243 [Drosophila bunnanda]